eukprot:jgi/Bigna1/89807/estExt_fgenesh1_pg.C_560005
MATPKGKSFYHLYLDARNRKWSKVVQRLHQLTSEECRHSLCYQSRGGYTIMHQAALSASREVIEILLSLPGGQKSLGFRTIKDLKGATRKLLPVDLAKELRKDKQTLKMLTPSESEEKTKDKAKSDCLKDDSERKEEHRDLTVVCISDTHTHHAKLGTLPRGDILIHAGDFTETGRPENIEAFLKWFEGQPHKHKILISGNHEMTLDREFYSRAPRKRFHHKRAYDAKETRELVTNPKRRFTYLENNSVCVEGITIFGTPLTPPHAKTAFERPREKLRFEFAQIPSNVDILVSHSPPYGILDFTRKHIHAGCKELLSIVRKVKPKFHIFGHIHEGHGKVILEDTIHVNACSIQGRGHMPKGFNAPITFKISRKGGKVDLEDDNR